MKKLLLCFLSLMVLPFSFAVAQKQKSKKSAIRKEHRAEKLKNEHVYRSRHLGVNYLNQQNTVVSPLVYKGFGASLGAERQILNGNTLKTNNVRLQVNLIKPINSEGLTQAGALQFGYDYLKLTGIDKLYIGGMVQLNSSVRIANYLANNGIQFEVFPTIGLSSRYKTDFKLFKRNFGIDASLKLPLVGELIATPKYAYSFDETTFSFMPVGKMLNPQTQVWLNLPTRKRFPNRQLRVGYEWNMNRFGRGNDRFMTMATHSIYFVASLEKLK